MHSRSENSGCVVFETLAQNGEAVYQLPVIRLARFLLVSALMISIGAQWAVLQSAAWISMAVSYSIKTGSVTEGLSQTFDGDHPCALCCVVKKGTESEKKDPKQETAKKKLELFTHGRAIVVIAPPTIEVDRGAENQFGKARAEAPPHQPPRWA
jgi:hypothetical protein